MSGLAGERITIHVGPLIEFAKWASVLRTPERRTQGFPDAQGVRGRGDYIDTLTSTATWGWLRCNGVACTLTMTGGVGDTADLLVHRPDYNYTVNVKGSYADLRHCHLAIKGCEATKLADVYVQVLHPPGSQEVKLVGWLGRKTILASPMGKIPNTDGTTGWWIPEEQLRNMKMLADLARWPGRWP